MGYEETDCTIMYIGQEKCYKMVYTNISKSIIADLWLVFAWTVTIIVCRSHINNRERTFNWMLDPPGVQFILIIFIT